MNWTIAATLLLVAVMGGAVVFTRDPRRQLFVMSGSGMALTLLFFVLQAADVAFSEIGVGAVIVPLLFLIALAAIDNETDRRRRAAEDDGDDTGERRGDPT